MATMHKRRTSKLSLEPNPFEHSFSLVRSEDVKAITEETGGLVAGAATVYAAAPKQQQQQQHQRLTSPSSDKVSLSSADQRSSDQAAAASISPSISPSSSSSSSISSGGSIGNNVTNGSNNVTGASALHSRVKLPPVTAINGPMHAAELTGQWRDSLRSGPLSPAMLGGPASNTAKGAAKTIARLGLTDPVLHTGLTPYIMGEMQPVVASGGFDCMKLPSSLATPGIQAIIKAAIEGQEIATTPGGSLKIASSTSATATAAAASANAVSSLPALSSTLQQPSADPANISSSVISARHQVIPLPSMALTAPPQVAATMAMQGLASSQATQPLAVEPASTQIATSASTINVEGSSGTSSKRAKRRKAAAGDNGGAADAAAALPKQKKKRARPTSNKANSNNGSSNDGRAASSHKQTARESSMEESREANDKSGAEDGSAAGQAQSDEEKRRQFLERNRIAALKCRQRKKKQLKELQERHDFISMQNEALQAEYLKLRELSLNLRALLVAHRECPVAQANGVYGIDSLPIGTPSVSLQPLLFSSCAEGEQAKEIIAAIPPANNGVPVHTVDPSTGKPIVVGIPHPRQLPCSTTVSAVDMIVGAAAAAASLPMIPQSSIVDPKARISVGPQFMALNN
ncbi:Transcription factor [Coemansia asiatica]|uniref:Transcription factor n=1 Tax=Coemansia asiatica TaxID=1052880 RepID=A0A9W8CI17_9FUNG|nr:Transcription factor [Coemansia asiatica]